MRLRRAQPPLNGPRDEGRPGEPARRAGTRAEPRAGGAVPGAGRPRGMLGDRHLRGGHRGPPEPLEIGEGRREGTPRAPRGGALAGLRGVEGRPAAAGVRVVPTCPGLREDGAPGRGFRFLTITGRR